MTKVTLDDLQVSIFDTAGFGILEEYGLLAKNYLEYIQDAKPTEIISPTSPNYRFYQYSEQYGNKITRPINFDLFIKSPDQFQTAFERFGNILEDFRRNGDKAKEMSTVSKLLDSNFLNETIYTVQQAIGSISDSFNNPNRARKRTGQLFENLITLTIRNMGIECESRTIQIPIPDTDGKTMSYELDLVISREKLILTSETPFIHPDEIIGSVKTTSKDRIDKIFLDKQMISSFLDMPVKVVGVFLHDVQRARRGTSIFGINSTFKTNHFIGYSKSLNELDGVYYVDPRPNMLTDKELKTRIFPFQKFITQDIWKLI